MLHRRNTKESQANIYLKGAIGLADNDNTYGAASAGIAIDWETRRYFTSYENRYLTTEPIENNFDQKARIGIAPYIGNYGDLHTWLMLEAQHTPEADDKFELTPLIRLFKGAHLIEGGISFDGNATANYIKRF